MMNWKKIDKDLLRFLEDAVPRTYEDTRYGVPHLVGEIELSNDDPRVDLSTVIFNGSRYPLAFLDEGFFKFMYPIEDANPYVVFLEVMNFFEKTLGDSSFRVVLRTSPLEFLRGIGLEVLWTSEYMMGGSEFVQVWAVSETSRYNLLFEKRGDSFLFRDIKKVDEPQ